MEVPQPLQNLLESTAGITDSETTDARANAPSEFSATETAPVFSTPKNRERPPVLVPHAPRKRRRTPRHFENDRHCDRDASATEAERVCSVRRRLFGRVDQDNSPEPATGEDTQLHAAGQRWNFDFGSETPLEGRWQWQVVEMGEQRKCL